MAQLDDVVGLVMQKIEDIGEDDNTIVLFTTDNGTEVFTWPDGGQTPVAQSKGTVLEGGFRVPAILRWPGHVPADSVQNGSSPDSTGCQPLSPRLEIRTSPRNCLRAKKSVTAPTRTIWTATTRWTPSLERARPLVG